MKYKILIFSLIIPVLTFGNTTGIATGEGDSDQAVAHGLGVMPELVIASVMTDTNDFGCQSFMIYGDNPAEAFNMTQNMSRVALNFPLDVDYFYLDSNIALQSNGDLCQYSWIAFETSVGGGGDPVPVVEVSQGIQAETYATTLYVAGMSSLLYLTVATVKRFRQKKRPGGR